MNFAEKWTEKKDVRPIILCDVEGTLLLKNEGTHSVEPNQQLITELNNAARNGFNVRLVTERFDTGTWMIDKNILSKTTINPAILKNVGGKKSINETTFTNVAAIIDDRDEGYIAQVAKNNPNAKHFGPNETGDLHLHIVEQKPNLVQVG